MTMALARWRPSMPASKPGRPRTTGSKSTPTVQFRIGREDRTAADAVAGERGVTVGRLAREALLALLRRELR